MVTNYIYPPRLRAPLGIANKVNPARHVESRRDNTMEAFSAIYNKYFSKIYRYILFRVADEKTAEDLTSQVFMKAWEKIDQYEPTGAQFVTWLFTIARNTTIDHYRTQKETVTLENSLKEPSNCLSPEEESVSHFEKESLRKAIQCLTREQQNVVILKFINGMSTEEIASQLGKRAGTVRALQMRALQSLSRQMEKTS